jgi:hypothetical protein
MRKLNCAVPTAEPLKDRSVISPASIDAGPLLKEVLSRHSAEIVVCVRDLHR